MNTNSNTYTIVYASVMVIIVAFLLAFVSSSLKDIQNENVALDKKKQILSSLNINLKDADVSKLYSEIVLKEQVINSEGEVIAETGAFDIVSKKQNAEPLAKRKLPLYVCQINGETKYVLPVYGAGLWGPGLGADIALPKFQNQFPGKKISREGEFTSIAIVKPGKTDDTKDYVNGISGGTITSQGVDAMLLEGLGQYVNFLKQ